MQYAVQALREVAPQVGKKDWNFSVDPCSSESSWFTPKSDLRPLYNNSLICNCSYPAGVCHVVQLYVTLHFPYIEIVSRSCFYSTKIRSIFSYASEKYLNLTYIGNQKSTSIFFYVSEKYLNLLLLLFFFL